MYFALEVRGEHCREEGQVAAPQDQRTYRPISIISSNANISQLWEQLFTQHARALRDYFKDVQALMALLLRSADPECQEVYACCLVRKLH